MSSRLALVVALILGLAWAVFWAGSDVWTHAEEADGVPVEGELEAVAAEKPARPLEPRLPDQGLTRREVYAAQGRVVDADGQAVLGAELSWSSAHGDDADAFRTRSSEAGRFAFVEGPRSATSVLFVTAVGFELFESDVSATAPVPERIVLQAAPARTVRVVDGRGRALAGVEVRHRRPPENSERRPELVRRATTNTTGEVRLARLAAVEEFQVVEDQTVLLDWVRRGETELVLVVPGSFQASGTVRNGAPQGSFVRCEIVADELEVEPLETPVDGAGKWGPVTLACLDGATYRLRLEGPSLVPELQVRTTCPGNGRELVVDFEGDPGHVLWFELRDQAETRLTGGRVQVTWTDGGESFSVEAAARDEDGYVQVTGIRSGAVLPIASVAGYATKSGLPLIVPEPEPVIHVMNLYPEVTLHGKVTYGGDPVSDFTIQRWNPRRLNSAATQHFREREDGRFELTGCEATLLEFVASAAGLGSSRVESFDVRTASELELRLTDAGVAVGRVVDRASFEPIPGATVRLGVMGPGKHFLPLTEPLATSADGGFALEGLPPHPVLLLAEAPGFSRSEQTSPGAAASEWIVGDVALSRAQALTFELKGHGTNDPADYSIASRDGRGLPAKTFGPDGKVRYAEVGEGNLTMLVTLPNQDDLLIKDNLWPGKEWVVPVHVGGDGALEVEVVGPAELLERGDLRLKLAYEPTKGRPLERFVPFEGTAARIAGLPRGDISVLLTNSDGNLASAAVSLRLHATASLRLEVGGPGRRVRVVDVSGSAVAGASVSYGRIRERTDANGEATLLASVPLDVSLDLEHPDLGSHLGASARLSPDPAVTTTLVFDPNHTVELTFQEAGQPVAGFKAGLERPGSSYAASETEHVSGADGRVRWTRLGPGRYVVSGTKPGYFFSSTLVEADTPAAAPVRRTCDVVLRVLPTDGSPAAGASVDLHSLEFDQSSTGWAAANLLRLPQGNRTDASGSLTIQGLPEGAYRWTVSLSSGARATGEASLHTGQVNSLELRVP